MHGFNFNCTNVHGSYSRLVHASSSRRVHFKNTGQRNPMALYTKNVMNAQRWIWWNAQETYELTSTSHCVIRVLVKWLVCIFFCFVLCNGMVHARHSTFQSLQFLWWIRLRMCAHVRWHLCSPVKQMFICRISFYGMYLVHLYRIYKYICVSCECAVNLLCTRIWYRCCVPTFRPNNKMHAMFSMRDASICEMGI